MPEIPGQELLGSFSRVFHKISAAYGWSDKRIKNLTIRRMRQISAAIDEAEWSKRFNDRQLVAWQTRMLCSWLVKLTPDMSSDMANQLLKEAQGISLDGMNPSVEDEDSNQNVVRPSKALPSKKEFYKMSEEDIESNLGKADNAEGSFEALMGSLGRRFSRPN